MQVGIWTIVYHLLTISLLKTIENNHSLIYNMTADQHNMFIIRPWKEVPQTVDLGASPSLPAVFFSSLLWLHKPAQSTCHYCSL
jgi:hypothetical protein